MGKVMFCHRLVVLPGVKWIFLTSVICPVPTAAAGENSPPFVMANPHATQRKLIRVGANELVKNYIRLTHSRIRGCTETQTRTPAEMVSISVIGEGKAMAFAGCYQSICTRRFTSCQVIYDFRQRSRYQAWADRLEERKLHCRTLSMAQLVLVRSSCICNCLFYPWINRNEGHYQQQYFFTNI